MPGRHVGNICLGGDPLKPGVNPEAEGERFESVKEAGRSRSSRVALSKGCDRTSIIDLMDRTRAPELGD